MGWTFVRDHPGGTSKTPSTTFIATTDASNIIPAGRQVLVAVTTDNLTSTTPTVSSISVPTGELNNWKVLADVNASTATATVACRTIVWAMTTTVDWPAASSLAITLSSTVTAKVAIIKEFSGGSLNFRGTGTNKDSETGGVISVTLNATTNTVQPQAGDLVVAFGGWETSYATMTNGIDYIPDTDTLGGVAWSTSVINGTTGGSDSTNVSIASQYKIPTANADQQWNPSCIGDTAGVIIVLRPATQYNNTAEGGSNGTFVTAANSGGTSGDAWDTVTGSPAQFSSAQAMHGSLSHAMNGNTATYVQKNFPTSGAVFAGRFYINVNANPTAVVRVFSLVNNSAGNDFSIGLNTTRNLVILNSSGGNVALFTAALSTNTWYRVEYTMWAGSTGAGTCVVKLFSGDSTTPIETQTLTAQSFGAGAIASAKYWGISAAQTYYLDDIAENDSGAWIGPAVPLTTNISLTRTLKWNTNVQVSLSRILKWNTKGTISTSRTLLWNTKGTISLTRTLLWNTKQTIAPSRTLKWNTRQSITTSRTVLWSTRGTISLSRILKWGVKQQISVSRILKWNTGARVSTARTLLWNTRATISTSRIFKWNTRTAVATIARTFKWNTFAQALVARTLKWNTKQTISTSRIFKWNTREQIISVKTLKWNTRVQINNQKTLLWNTRQTIAVVRIFKWNVFIGVILSRSLKWNVRGYVVISRTLLWHVYRDWVAVGSSSSLWTELNENPATWTELDHATTGWH